jgi:indole-3-glycerol phosphate synthase
MPAGLSHILDATRHRVIGAKRAADLRNLEKRADAHIPRGFRRSLALKSQTGPAIIAELKKASPSRGLIRPNFNAGDLAAELEGAGAAALSVLTDEEFFQGSLSNLQGASANTALPCLRKDFIVDEFQILEARANGGDAILLIVAALTPSEMTAFAQRARELELDVLCEVHDRQELVRAVDAGCNLIGVNNRDLRTFQVDLDTAFRLAEFIPQNAVRVAESGIHSGGDIARLRSAGYQAFLIGESLMKAPSPGKALRNLLVESESKVPSSTR